MMRRRDFVKGILAASAAVKTAMGQQAPASAAAPVAPATPATTPTAPGPVPWMRGLLDAKPLPMTPLVADAVAASEAKFFNPQQTATLRRFAEVLMPPLKGYPGALEAGTPEFLDFLIGVSPTDRQQLYRVGLDALNAHARKQFSKSFAELDDAQAHTILQPMLVAVPWPKDPPKDPLQQFLFAVREDVPMATRNSPEYSAAAANAGRRTGGGGLVWNPIDPVYRG